MCCSRSAGDQPGVRVFVTCFSCTAFGSCFVRVSHDVTATDPLYEFVDEF